MFQDFFKGKKVLVTGHTGFKGSWLVIWLNRLGAHVSGIALDPEDEKSLFDLSGVHENIMDYRMDIRNLDEIKFIISREKPEIVFHLAAQALVLEGYANPVNTYQTNIMGTVHILEALRDVDSIRSAVMVTSDKCYDNREWPWGYRENDPMGGSDPYSSSKGAAELIINAYRQSYYTGENAPGIASARAGNVIGGGDFARYRIIPDCIRSFEKDEEVRLRNPLAVRPWQHVLEPLGGYLLLAQKLYEKTNKYSEAFNFGPLPDQNRTVEELVREFIKLYGKGNVGYHNSLPQKEAGNLALDISKAISCLKWKPLLDFETMLRMTADWYREYQNGNPFELCARQIDQYTKLWNSSPAG